MGAANYDEAMSAAFKETPELALVDLRLPGRSGLDIVRRLKELDDTTNVVVLFQRFRIDTKIEPGHARPDLTTVGSGKAIVYQEGHRIEATWRKVDDTGPTRLFDADSGVELPLVRGRTFFQVVPTGTKVSDRAEGG